MAAAKLKRWLVYDPEGMFAHPEVVEAATPEDAALAPEGGEFAADYVKSRYRVVEVTGKPVDLEVQAVPVRL